jgi:hypothetical protein
MKAPRFRIAWVMVAVAISALDFWAIRAVLEFPTPKGELLIVGALPMANVLAFAILIGLWRPASRPFLLGFQAFGAIALALYVAGAIFFFDELVMSYLASFLRPIATVIGQRPRVVLIPIFFSSAIIMLGLPQLAFALLGGFLFRKFRITIAPG